MISRTWLSAVSASCTNGPQLDRSPGISSSSSQRPLTWPNRSSCGRMSWFMPARASSRMLTTAEPKRRPRNPDYADPHDRLAERTALVDVQQRAAEGVEAVRRPDRRVDRPRLHQRQQGGPLLLHVAGPGHRVGTPAHPTDVDVVEQQAVDLDLRDRLPRCEAHHQHPASGREQPQGVGEGVAADHVQDHVHAAPAGEVGDRVLEPVEQHHVVRAEGPHQIGLRLRRDDGDHPRAEASRHLDRRRTDTAGGAVHQHRLALAEVASFEQCEVGGQVVQREGGALLEAEDVG